MAGSTVVGVVLAAVVAAGIGAAGTVVVVNTQVATADKAATSANTADLGKPDDYGTR